MAIRWQLRDLPRPGFPLLDPGNELRRATSGMSYGLRSGRRAGQWIPVMLELAITARRFAAGDWFKPGAPKSWHEWLRIPSMYATPPSGLSGITFCTATVRPRFFDLLREDSALRRTVKRFELCVPVNLGTDTLPVPALALTARSAPTVVVAGVIDEGMAFAQDRFLLANGSARVEYVWNQGDPANSLPGFGYGSELRKKTLGGVPGIDQYLQLSRHAGLVDEEEFYRRCGQLEYATRGHKSLGRRASHGSHVLHAACALDTGVLEDERPIVCVQLPSEVVADTSGASGARHIYDGLLYILQRADAIAEGIGSGPLKVVANVSFGNIAGPHDGTSILEKAIDQLIDQRGTAYPKAPFNVVLPSGNSRLARCHARHSFTAVGQRRRMHWAVQPDDATPSGMQIWLPHPASNPDSPVLSIRVRPPGGAWGPWTTENQVCTGSIGASVVFAMVYLGAALNGDRSTVWLWLAPTATHHPTQSLAPSGIWDVELRRESAGRRFVAHAWIQRDDKPFGYPIRGRQSRFEDGAYLRKHPLSGRDIETDQAGSYVKRDGSINAYATGKKTIVIGGFRDSDFTVWKHSAGGPIIPAPGSAPPAHRDGPDALAPSEDSPSHHGRLAAGNRSGSTVAMNGTSVAAPQVARLAANMMAASGKGDRGEVRALAQLQENSPPPRPTPKPPSKRGGEGRIDLPPLIRR